MGNDLGVRTSGMKSMPPEARPRKRKFRLQYRNTNPERIIESENIRIEHGFVIFADGPEYAEKTNFRAYSTLNMVMIEEVFDGESAESS